MEQTERDVAIRILLVPKSSSPLLSFSFLDEQSGVDSDSQNAPSVWATRKKRTIKASTGGVAERRAALTEEAGQFVMPGDTDETVPRSQATL